MKTPLTLADKPIIGPEVRRLRLSSLLNQQDLANLAGVPRAHVNLVEHNYPVPLDSKRRILRELWSLKTKK